MSAAQVLLLEMPIVPGLNQGAPVFTDYTAFLSAAGWVPFDVPEVHKTLGAHRPHILTQLDMVWVRSASEIGGRLATKVKTYLRNYNPTRFHG